MEESFASGARRRGRPPRRPERQQILLRRALALGVGLLILILLVLGVRGCLNARADRALRDYANDVTQIVEETQQTSSRFFGRLADPGELSVTDFIGEVEADRSAMDNYVSRVYALDAPGDMADAQNALELTYSLRGSAMATIAERMSTALGEAGAQKAIAGISNQIRKLAASDVVYAAVVRPEINNTLAAKGLEGNDVPKSIFVPEGTTWLEEGAVTNALGAVSGNVGGATTPGVHGLGLIGASLNGTELVPEGTVAVVAEGTPELDVRVQNQGESTENGITVNVTFGNNSVQGDIDSLAAGEEGTVTIPLTPAPKGEVTIEVVVEPVPGEQVTENNEATYTVTLE